MIILHHYERAKERSSARINVHLENVRAISVDKIRGWHSDTDPGLSVLTPLESPSFGTPQNVPPGNIFAALAEKEIGWKQRGDFCRAAIDYCSALWCCAGGLAKNIRTLQIYHPPLLEIIKIVETVPTCCSTNYLHTNKSLSPIRVSFLKANIIKWLYIDVDICESISIYR